MGVSEMGTDGKKVLMSIYKISKSWGCNVQQYCTVHLKVAKKVDIKNSYHKEKIIIMCGDKY